MHIIERPTSAGGLALAARTSGEVSGSSACPVVLVHGIAADHSTWRRLAGRLRRAGRPVLSVDLRGHGRSGRADEYRLESFADDVAHVLDHLGVRSADVVGHSLGAHTALRLAMSRPDLVQSLVLEEIPPMPRDEADSDEGITMSAGLGERLRGIRAAVANPTPLLRFDRSMPEQITDQFAHADPPWWDRAAAVGVPTLVVSGGPRSFLPTRHLRSLTDALPNAELAVIETGHSVHRDRGDDFNRAVEGFLAR